jgi:NosR/NirI family nitrous oxide reductase transcriptional regulator
LTGERRDRHHAGVLTKGLPVLRTASLAALGFLCIRLAVGQVQPPMDPVAKFQLKVIFPDAATFSSKQGSPAHYRVYAAAAKGEEPKLLGLAWWTTELEPLERGFDGPIKMLVGMDTTGILKGVVVTEDHEPYGDFSVETPAFAAQFKGKDIRDPFKVGQDIDAISRATISVTSASRAVRNSARRIARELLTPPEKK